MTTHTPVLRSGQAVRTYGVARALASHRGLDLLYVRFGAEEPDAAFRAIPGIALHEAVPSRGVRRLRAYAQRAPARRAAATSRAGSHPSWRPAPARSPARIERGRVIADGPIAAAALARLARRRPVIYNAHNLESAFRGELCRR